MRDARPPPVVEPHRGDALARGEEAHRLRAAQPRDGVVELAEQAQQRGEQVHAPPVDDGAELEVEPVEAGAFAQLEVELALELEQPPGPVGGEGDVPAELAPARHGAAEELLRERAVDAGARDPAAALRLGEAVLVRPAGGRRHPEPRQLAPRGGLGLHVALDQDRRAVAVDRQHPRPAAIGHDLAFVGEGQRAEHHARLGVEPLGRGEVAAQRRAGEEEADARPSADAPQAGVGGRQQLGPVGKAPAQLGG
ncbi:MAG: hypothetical protein ACO3CC_00945, partial [Alphaproteobacteria bacterium]